MENDTISYTLGFAINSAILNVLVFLYSHPFLSTLLLVLVFQAVLYSIPYWPRFRDRFGLWPLNTRQLREISLSLERSQLQVRGVEAAMNDQFMALQAAVDEQRVTLLTINNQMIHQQQLLDQACGQITSIRASSEQQLALASRSHKAERAAKALRKLIKDGVLDQNDVGGSISDWSAEELEEFELDTSSDASAD